MNTRFPVFVPNTFAGNRKDTAVLLVGTAAEFDVPGRDISSTHTGFYITERFAEVLYDEGVMDRPGATKPKPKKTSGNRAAKTKNPGKGSTT